MGSPRLFLLVGALVFLLLVAGGIVISRQGQKPPTLPAPTPVISPLPTPSPTPAPWEATPKPILLQGKLKKLEFSLHMQGTHYLEKEGKILALLTSQTLNLDNYLEEEVEVEGKALPAVEGNEIIIEVKAVKVISEK